MIRKHIIQPVAELLTHALITSRLVTCNSLLHGLNKPQLKRLQRLHNTAARLVPFSMKYTQKLHWLPIEQRIIFKISMFVFKKIHGILPIYLCSLVKPYDLLRRNMRSSNKLLLTEHSWEARSFALSAANAWNTLPTNIRASATISIFKTPLKTHLFKAYFE